MARATRPSVTRAIRCDAPDRAGLDSGAETAHSSRQTAAESPSRRPGAREAPCHLTRATHGPHLDQRRRGGRVPGHRPARERDLALRVPSGGAAGRSPPRSGRDGRMAGVPPARRRPNGHAGPATRPGRRGGSARFDASRVGPSPAAGPCPSRRGRVLPLARQGIARRPSDPGTGGRPDRPPASPVRPDGFAGSASRLRGGQGRRPRARAASRARRGDHPVAPAPFPARGRRHGGEGQ